MTSPDTAPSRLARLLETGGWVALAIVVMNLGTYGFQIISARLVGPAEYGGIASLLAIQLVMSVLQLGLQTTAARRIASAEDNPIAVQREVIRLAWRASIALALVTAALSPLMVKVLQLNSVYPALLVAVGVIPMTVVGAQTGVLQGSRRWGLLALLYLASGGPRLLLGAIALSIRPTEGSAMAAVALGWVVAALVGHWGVRQSNAMAPPEVESADPAASEPPSEPVSGPPSGPASGPGHTIPREVLGAALALLGFFALSNLDIVVARQLLSAHDSGLYAGGLILTKAVLFLPQFVAVLAFPSMSSAASRRLVLLRSLAIVGLSGFACVLGVLALPGLAMVFVGGSDYSEIQSMLWEFALLGTTLSALQVIVYSVLARQGRRSAWLIWMTVIALVGAAMIWVETLEQLLTLVTVVDVILVLALVAASLRSMKADQPTPITSV